MARTMVFKVVPAGTSATPAMLKDAASSPCDRIGSHIACCAQVSGPLATLGARNEMRISRSSIQVAGLPDGSRVGGSAMAASASHRDRPTACRVGSGRVLTGPVGDLQQTALELVGERLPGGGGPPGQLD